MTTCFLDQTDMLWDKHKDSMTDDILHRLHTRSNDLTKTFSKTMYNEALIAIEDPCVVIAHLLISNFGMPSPNRSASDFMNTEVCTRIFDAPGRTSKTFLISQILAEIMASHWQ